MLFLNFHIEFMTLFHITFICIVHDIVLPNKYLSIFYGEGKFTRYLILRENFFLQKYLRNMHNESYILLSLVR